MKHTVSFVNIISVFFILLLSFQLSNILQHTILEGATTQSDLIQQNVKENTSSVSRLESVIPSITEIRERINKNIKILKIDSNENFRFNKETVKRMKNSSGANGKALGIKPCCKEGEQESSRCTYCDYDE